MIFPRSPSTRPLTRHFLRIPAAASLSGTRSRAHHSIQARPGILHGDTAAPSPAQSRGFSSSSVTGKWEGRPADENTAREKDAYNVQHDAVKEGKGKRAEGEGGVATSEKGGEANRKAENENKEAPKPVIGMNDERGSASS